MTMFKPGLLLRGYLLSQLACLLIVGLVGMAALPVHAMDKIRYPVGLNADPERRDYLVEMLKLAVQKSGTKASLEAVRSDLNKIRTLMELQKGGQVDVYWGGASNEREAAMLPIRICLMKGLMGWRIPLVTKKNEHMFAQVETLDDLKKLSAGQGFHWTDTQVLLGSEIRVERSYEYDNLLKMLVAGRFDYFPRSIMEIWDEVARHSEMDILVDTHVVIHYPTAFYFFVKKDNRELADLLERGLEIAIKDGSFNKLFYEHHKSRILQAHIENRRIIELKNPLLPARTPLERKDLWFSVSDLKQLSH